jgi:hypothetical protein
MVPALHPSQRLALARGARALGSRVPKGRRNCTPIHVMSASSFADDARTKRRRDEETWRPPRRAHSCSQNERSTPGTQMVVARRSIRVFVMFGCSATALTSRLIGARASSTSWRSPVAQAFGRRGEGWTRSELNREALRDSGLATVGKCAIRLGHLSLCVVFSLLVPRPSDEWDLIDDPIDTGVQSSDRSAKSRSNLRFSIDQWLARSRFAGGKAAARCMPHNNSIWMPLDAYVE